MKDMKMTPAENKAMTEPALPSTDAPKDRYPYGLQITLDQDTLDKLGIDMPEVGEEVNITAVAKVVSCHSSESDGGGKNASCSLQITQMQVDEESDPAEIAGRMYGGSGDAEA